MDDILNVGDDLRNIFSDPGEIIRLFDAKTVHILEKISFPSSGEFEIFDTFELRVVDDLVVNISDIHSELDYDKCTLTL